MALEEVLRALEAEAHARCAEIRSNASEEAERIAEQAKCRCEQLVHDRLDAHTGAVAIRARRMVSEARMDSRYELSAERDRLIEEIFDAARESLAAARTGSGYPEMLDRLLEEALASTSDPTSVLVDPRDADLVESLLTKRGRKVPVRGEITTGAGVIVLSNGDRVGRDNTAEARLARVRELSRERVGEMLFG